MSEAKLTFGIQPKQIEIIEHHLKQWRDEMEGEYIYSKAFWDMVAPYAGWEPFTLALAYLKHINKIKKP